MKKRLIPVVFALCCLLLVTGIAVAVPACPNACPDGHMDLVEVYFTFTYVDNPDGITTTVYQWENRIFECSVCGTQARSRVLADKYVI